MYFRVMLDSMTLTGIKEAKQELMAQMMFTLPKEVLKEVLFSNDDLFQIVVKPYDSGGYWCYLQYMRWF